MLKVISFISLIIYFTEDGYVRRVNKIGVRDVLLVDGVQVIILGLEVGLLVGAVGLVLFTR